MKTNRKTKLVFFNCTFSFISLCRIILIKVLILDMTNWNLAKVFFSFVVIVVVIAAAVGDCSRRMSKKCKYKICFGNNNFLRHNIIRLPRVYILLSNACPSWIGRQRSWHLTVHRKWRKRKKNLKRSLGTVKKKKSQRK